MRTRVRRALSMVVALSSVSVAVSLCGATAVFAAAPALPDGRGYELVSAGNENSNVSEPELLGQSWNAEGIGDSTQLPFQAAADGGAVAYAGDPPPAGGNGSVGHSEGNQYLARRLGAGGWSATDLQPPLLEAPIYQAFSSDLSMGMLDSAEALSAAAPAGYDVLYSAVPGSGAYSPLFTVTPPHRTAYSLEAFGVKAVGLRFRQGQVAYAGASADLKHLLFEANDALTAEAVDGGREANNLYDSVDGVLRSVNVLPGGEPEANATFGSSHGEPDFSRVISSDGSRVFWTDLSTGEIYVRENDATSHPTTVAVGNGVYWTASMDGSQVFFTSAGVLYRYDVESGATADLSVDSHPGEEAGVQGVVGTSEDGSYVYFVATGNLATGATPGEDNLYVTHNGAIAFIADLASEDVQKSDATRPGFQFGDMAGDPGGREAEVTPDGRHLAFASVRNLTGYESAGHWEIFVYDTASGGLSCASCNPTGEPPATAIHSAGVPLSWSTTYEQRWFSSDGSRVFFDSGEALVPQDQNGQVDAYEWEQDGAGSCRRVGGCIYLLSGGTSADGSFVLDASASGDDVFIITRGQLAPADRNEVFDVYDVRMGAGETLSAPVCPSSGCESPAALAPVFATPSSVTFSGAGNVPPSPPAIVVKKAKRRPVRCAKGRKLKHGRCVKVKARGRKAGNARIRSMREGR
jgi:hypothetical protein